ncbi:MAG: hypothetical protein AB1758_35025, partial [Candidatus Eremiobacterota bacterium]
APEPAPKAEEPPAKPAAKAEEAPAGDTINHLLNRLEAEEEAEPEEPVYLSATDLLAKLEIEDQKAAAEVLQEAARETPEQEVPEEEVPATVSLLDPLQGAGPGLVWTQDPALLEQVEKGMQLLRHLNLDESFEFFSQLNQQHPGVAQVEAGLFYNYASFSCWMEAYEHGKRLAPLMAGRDDEQFVGTMTQVLNERISQSRSMADKKRCLLELAELHLKDPEQALDYLRRAKRIPNPIRGEGRIDYYLTSLLAGTPEDRSGYLRNYLGSVADSAAVFRHLDEVYREGRHRVQAPVARAIVALGREGEARVRAVEAEAGDLLAPAGPAPELLEQTWNKDEGPLLKLFLDTLLPKARVTPRFPAPHFYTLMDHCEAPPDNWQPRKILQADNSKMFSLPRIEYRRYVGPDSFMVKASPEPDITVIVHREAEGLPVGQLRFFLLSAMYQVKKRHLHLYRAAEMLDDEGRLRLLNACRDHVIQSGVDISDSLERKIEALKPETPGFSDSLSALVEQLYDHTLSDEFDDLKDFLFLPRPFRDELQGAADRFATRLVGLTEASYAVAREELVQSPDMLEEIRSHGFAALYAGPLETHRELRLRLQRVWLGPLLRAHM